MDFISFPLKDKQRRQKLFNSAPSYGGIYPNVEMVFFLFSLFYIT